MKPYEAVPSHAVTHPGRFHADDVFAGAILRVVYGSSLRLMRSDDANDWYSAPIVYDVGKCYDPQSYRFDHHQSDVPPNPCGTPFSSAGLIWKQLAHDAILAIDPTVTPEMIPAIAEKIRQLVILPLDAWDNGIFPNWKNQAILPFQILVNASVQGGDVDDGYQVAVLFAQRALTGLILQQIKDLQRYEILQSLTDGVVTTGTSLLQTNDQQLWLYSRTHTFMFHDTVTWFARKFIPLHGCICPPPQGRKGLWNIYSTTKLPSFKDECYRAPNHQFAVIENLSSAMKILKLKPTNIDNHQTLHFSISSNY